MESFDDTMKRIEEKYNREHNIDCPYCGERIREDDETLNDNVTYHGQEEPFKIDCPECDKTFLVKEIVDRTWEVSQLK